MLRAYRERGDIRARDRVVQLYLPVVEGFAHRFARPGADRDDLVQAGSIGLLNAIERFDPKRGEEFAAYALPTIAGEIKRHIRDRGSTVRLPRRLHEARARLTSTRAELTRRLGRSPSDDELAAALDVEPRELPDVTGAREAPLDAGEVADDRAAGLAASDDRLVLAGAFRALDETERRIVHLRFVRDLTLAEAAAELGIPERELGRRTEAALAKLRREIEQGPGQARDAPAPPAQKPAPVKSRRRHSGRLLLRMPQELHSELAQAAEREEQSLNQFITRTLAGAVGWRDPATGEPAPGLERARSTPRWLRVAIAVNVTIVVVAAVVAIVLLLLAWRG